jgi:hypothetical protein
VIVPPPEPLQETVIDDPVPVVGVPPVTVQLYATPDWGITEYCEGDTHVVCGPVITGGVTG